MNFFDAITRSVENLSPWMVNIIESIAIVIFTIVLRAVVLSVVRRRSASSKTYFYWRKVTAYVAFGLSALVIASVWFQRIGEIATYLGLLSAGLAVALKDPLTNIIGWIYILWQRPFSVGDRVEIDSIRGDVVDVRLFAFSMLEVGNWVFEEQSTGRLVHVPNARIFTGELFNYSQGFNFVWDELRTVVTFESDWRRAKELISAIGEEHAESIVPEATAELERASRAYLISYRTLSPKVYTSIVDHGVSLTLRHLTPVRRRRTEREYIFEEILDGFEREDRIALAYPTRRITVGPHEELSRGASHVSGAPEERDSGAPEQDGVSAPGGEGGPSSDRVESM
jgi:small-conductance mechanosensitive channel